MNAASTIPKISAAPGAPFHRARFDFASFFFGGMTGLATLLILAILAVILGNIFWQRVFRKLLQVAERREAGPMQGGVATMPHRVRVQT